VEIALIDFGDGGVWTSCGGAAILRDGREIGVMNLNASWRRLVLGWGELLGSGGGARSWLRRGCCVEVNEGGRLLKCGNQATVCDAGRDAERSPETVGSTRRFRGGKPSWDFRCDGLGGVCSSRRGEFPRLEEGSESVGGSAQWMRKVIS